MESNQEIPQNDGSEGIKENNSNLKFDSRGKYVHKPLSQKKKYFLLLIFVLAIPLSYPTVMPLGILCSAILLFQKNKKVQRAAVFLIILQALFIIGMFFYYLPNTT